MAGGTKRLPRAVREQQMLDAAVKVFAQNGFREASMDPIAAEAQISKPMLYLYYGSKDELFSACIARESGRFIDAMAIGFDTTLRQRDQARTVVREFLGYVDQHRQSWKVLYRVAIGTANFAQIVRDSRDRVTDMVAELIRRGTTVEGAATARAVAALAPRLGIELPLSRLVAGLAEGRIAVEHAPDILLNRPLKEE